MSYVKIGVAGPVGSGKTALIEALSRKMAKDYSIGVITNDIYTKEDAQFLAKNSVLPVERIIGVETGGCPHTAIREDASMNLEAVDATSLYSSVSAKQEWLSVPVRQVEPCGRKHFPIQHLRHCAKRTSSSLFLYSKHSLPAGISPVHNDKPASHLRYRLLRWGNRYIAPCPESGQPHYWKSLSEEKPMHWVLSPRILPCGKRRIHPQHYKL